MVSPLQGSQAAPWLPWSLESSPEPSEAWYQGWLGELCRSKDGPFNVLQALQFLDVALAVRVYRQMGDAGMVMALQKLQSIEDSNLLAGHVSDMRL